MSKSESQHVSVTEPGGLAFSKLLTRQRQEQGKEDPRTLAVRNIVVVDPRV